jgi:hypothetical protein
LLLLLPLLTQSLENRGAGPAGYHLLLLLLLPLLLLDLWTKAKLHPTMPPAACRLAVPLP